MKVYYKAIIGPKVSEPSRWEQIGDIKPCCEMMKEALEKEAIVFKDFPDYGEGHGLCFSLCHPWPEGASFDHFLIHFCPFCGQNIEIEEKLRVKLKARQVLRTGFDTEYDEEQVSV